MGGAFVNASKLDKFNNFLQYIAPSKYGTEIYFRIISDKLKDSDPVKHEKYLEFYNYTMGYGLCYLYLYLIGVVYLILGMIVITLKNRPLK